MFKKFTLFFPAAFAALLSFGQKKDSTVYDASKNDTMKIGRILIIRQNKSGTKDTLAQVSHVKHAKWPAGSRFTNSFLVFDIGNSAFTDKTDYSAPNNFIVNRQGGTPINQTDFSLKPRSSRNINIWFAMQQMALVKHNVTLKYGLGLELNNYSFKAPLSFRSGGNLPYTGMPATGPYVFKDSVSFKKDKLAADYFTVPLMLNFNSGDDGFFLGAGLSAGYLYSARNKQISTERGKKKYRGDFGINKFKWGYIGEVGYKNFGIYVSYSPKSVFSNGMDLRPYNVGLRFNYL